MSRVAEVLGKSLALAGFLFTVLTYAYNLHVDRQHERYKQATVLVEQYSKSGVLGFENELVQRSLYYNAGGLNLNNEENYPDEAFELIAKETLFGYDGRAQGGETKIKPFLGKLMDIMDFYARVGFCLDAEICDDRILRRFFCPRAKAFGERHSRLIAYYNDYGSSKAWSDGLDSFNRGCVGENG